VREKRPDFGVNAELAGGLAQGRRSGAGGAGRRQWRKRNTAAARARPARGFPFIGAWGTAHTARLPMASAAMPCLADGPWWAWRLGLAARPERVGSGPGARPNQVG
jgi:hypothetical protein